MLSRWMFLSTDAQLAERGAVDEHVTVVYSVISLAEIHRFHSSLSGRDHAPIYLVYSEENKAKKDEEKVEKKLPSYTINL